MSADLNKTFCIFPFIQTVVRTDGRLGPCCRISTDQNINDTTIDSFWTSKELREMRQFMLDGIPVSKCNVCYEQEKNNGKSSRTGALVDYKFFNEKHFIPTLEHLKLKDLEYPNRLEIHLGNLCNLKCLTCRPQDSSSFLTENVMLKISKDNQKDFQLSENAINEIFNKAVNQNLDILDLRGGETMLIPEIKKILSNWPEENTKSTTLRIQTNCTVFDNVWKKIFLKFKKIEIMMSIDAYGRSNEYIRFPSTWTEIEKNVAEFTSLPNAKTYINCTVSNLNFLLLPKLINWARHKNVYLHWIPLIYPTIFRYQNLPEELFSMGKQRLESYPEMAGLLKQSHDCQHWEDFCNTIDIRDNYRKNRIFDILPEFKNFWK